MNRRGAALLVALGTVLALAVLGALALSVARLQRIVARRSLASVAAAWAAQAGLARTFHEWQTLGPESLPVGGARSAGSTRLDPLSESLDSLIRLGRSLFEIRVVGERRDAGAMMTARETQSVLVSVVQPAAPDTAAVWAGGLLRVEGLAGVSGHDVVPAGWDSACAPASAASTGVMVERGAAVDTSGCTAPGCVTGKPPVTRDSLDSGSLYHGGLGLLRAAPDTVVGGTVPAPGPSIMGGACDSASGLNWGAPEDPSHPCFDRFRVIVARAGTHLAGGLGQGVLLARGDLVLEGDFRFYGVVVSSGSVILRGQSRVVGSVLAAPSGADSLLIAQGAHVTRSVCAVRRALRRVARPVPLSERAWSALP